MFRETENALNDMHQKQDGVLLLENVSHFVCMIPAHSITRSTTWFFNLCFSLHQTPFEAEDAVGLQLQAGIPQGVRAGL